MQCPKCGNDLLPAKDGGGFCQTCSEFFPSEPFNIHDEKGRALPRGERLVSLLPKLPSTLALMLDEYIHEVDHYQALHRMCGALEITARFLTAVALADVWGRRVSPDAEFPEELLKKLLQHLERPTLASWRDLLEAAIGVLPGGKGRKECLLPQLPDYVQKFATALGGGKADPLEKLLPMRNELAHGGRLSDERVKEFIDTHTERFEDLMNGLGFLSEDAGVMLVASPVKGPALLLRGVSTSATAFNRSQHPRRLSASRA
jgi:hypothetical protein